MNAQQLQFAQEYTIDFNATKAARRAGYSEKSARQQGERLLSNASIRNEVERLRAERAERTRVDADWVTYELVDTYRDARANGNHAAAFKGLDLLGKTLALYTDRVATGPDTWNVEIIIPNRTGADID